MDHAALPTRQKHFEERTLTSRSVAAAAIVALASLTATDAALAAQIKASYTMAFERIRPDPRPVNVTANFDVTLNEGGSVSERIQRNSGPASDKFNNSMKLGGGWRVAGPNQIVRTIDQPQSTLVVTITTSGSSCTIKPTWTLKSGFKEYKLKDIKDASSWSFYTQPQVTSSSCSIQ